MAKMPALGDKAGKSRGPSRPLSGWSRRRYAFSSKRSMRRSGTSQINETVT